MCLLRSISFAEARPYSLIWKVDMVSGSIQCFAFNKVAEQELLPLLQPSVSLPWHLLPKLLYTRRRTQKGRQSGLVGTNMCIFSENLGSRPG